MGKVLMKGNEAIGEAAIRAGCLNYFAYPITPPERGGRVPGPTHARGRRRISPGRERGGRGVYDFRCRCLPGPGCMTTSSSPGDQPHERSLELYRLRPMSGGLCQYHAWCGPGLGGILPSPGRLLTGHKGGRPRGLPDPGHGSGQCPGGRGDDDGGLSPGGEISQPRDDISVTVSSAR